MPDGDTTYDYVVVGAGSGGCVVAGRLSEDPDVRVCLVEAGPPDNDVRMRVPSGAAMLQQTEYDWDYDTAEEPFCGGRRIYLPRGKVLGGTSVLNGMVYTRGNPADYDGWAITGWTYRDLLPYFKRAEDNSRGEDDHHGVGGPLGVTDSWYRSPATSAFVQAATDAGFPANRDFCGPAQEGFGFYQITGRNGERCSAATAYLHPALARPNLTVETGVLVERVLFEGGRAAGVVARRGGERVTIRAAREVILAAGAYNSPQLLMLSGVGPADHLRATGIPVVADLPMVGQNLQDHPQCWLVFTHELPVSLAIGAEPRHARQYERDRTGPLASNGPEAGGFVRTGGDPYPDVQFHAVAAGLAGNRPADVGGHAFSMAPCVLAPRSRGSVGLVSADPAMKPHIRHNYFADEADLDTMVAGLRIGLQITRQSALAPFTQTRWQGPASDSDADLRAYARRNTHTLFHPAGTCAIGEVVDGDLRVRGVEGLRVVDTSVMPAIVRGNPNAPIIAIAERAVDLIRGNVPALAAAGA
ncbi:GMC family oxidoreductase [Micromonospora chersina]|uniref:GMC family oxidoreductase n=1 Tax=Micromonospora chersina TaxID=47854 RepID=UPI00340703BC